MEEKKEAVSKIKYDKQGRYIFLRLSLVNAHEALGILQDVMADLLDMIRIPRKMRAQQKMMEAKKNNGGTGVINGLKNNPKILK